MQAIPRWEPVAAAVRARMDELALSQADLARRSGLSDALVRSFMTAKFRGEPRRPNVLKLCAALGWTPISIDRLLDGQRPILVSEANAAALDQYRVLFGSTPISQPVGDEEMEALVVEMKRLAAFLELHDGALLALRADVDGLLRRERTRYGQGSA